MLIRSDILMCRIVVAAMLLSSTGLFRCCMPPSPRPQALGSSNLTNPLPAAPYMGKPFNSFRASALPLCVQPPCSKFRCSGKRIYSEFVYCMCLLHRYRQVHTHLDSIFHSCMFSSLGLFRQNLPLLHPSTSMQTASRFYCQPGNSLFNQVKQ